MKPPFLAMLISILLPSQVWSAQRCLLGDAVFENMSSHQSRVLSTKGAECVDQNTCFSADKDCFGGINRVASFSKDFQPIETYEDYQKYLVDDDDVKTKRLLSGRDLLFKGAILVNFDTGIFDDYTASFEWKGNGVNCFWIDEDDSIADHLLNASIGHEFNLSGTYDHGEEEIFLENCRLDLW